MESADYFCSNRDRQTDAQRGQKHNQLNYVGGGKNKSNILFGQLSTNSSSCIHITPATLVPVPRSTFTHRCLDTVKRPCPWVTCLVLRVHRDKHQQTDNIRRERVEWGTADRARWHVTIGWLHLSISSDIRYNQRFTDHQANTILYDMDRFT